MNCKIYFIILILALPFVDASYITLQTTISSSNNLVSISTTNKGDEPAYNIQLTLISPALEQSSGLKQSLGINEELKEEFDIDSSALLPGSYPLILITGYTDANNYPFSAISVASLVNKQATNAGLVLAMQPIKLSSSSKLKLEIKNLDNLDKQITARIIVPKELTIEEPKTMLLKARDSSKLSFSIKDFSARPDSSYAVFAIIEYESNNKHYSSISPSTVAIAKSIGIPTSLLTSSLAILLAIFIAYKIRKKHESKHSNPDTK